MLWTVVLIMGYLILIEFYPFSLHSSSCCYDQTQREQQGRTSGEQKNHYYRASDISQKKNQKFRGIFRGKFLEKSADFMGDFGGKLRQKTVGKKQPISLDFVLANSAKIDSIFASI